MLALKEKMMTLYIDGQWCDGQGQKFQSVSPHTGLSIWQGTAATSAQVETAITAAKTAFTTWSFTDFDVRLAVIKKYAETDL